MNKPKESQKSGQRSGRPIELKFLTSAVDMQGCPADDFPEVAIVGRSNAGKSSLINGLSNSKIAMVSSTPGKTRLLNFYQGRQFRLVDMPGYGFAQRSGGEQRDWQSMIEPFLALRGNLVGLLLVMDVRRDWSVDEENLLRWISPRQLPVAAALTKADKLSRSMMMKRQQMIRKQSGLQFLFPTSALKKQGFVELEEFVFRDWVRRARGGE